MENSANRPKTFKPLEIGQIYTNKRGEEYRIISRYVDTTYYLVEFSETGNLQYINGRQPAMALDKSKPFLYDVGYFKCDGEPIFYFESRVKTFYQVWTNMIVRCYKKDDSKQLSPWRDVEVCKEWLNFTNFYKWAITQPFVQNQRWMLDKDLFSPESGKIYSPETCCFLPSQINCQFSGLTYQDINNPESSTRMKQQSAYTSELLIKYESKLSERVVKKLWEICNACGIDREKAHLMARCSQITDQMLKMEDEIKHLRKFKAETEQKDIDGKYLQEQLPLMPTHGFVQHQGKIYRIDTAKDLYNMLMMVKNDMLAAPSPQNVKPKS